MNELTKRLQVDIDFLNSLKSIVENKKTLSGYQFVNLKEVDKNEANFEHDNKYFKSDVFLNGLYINMYKGNNQEIELEEYATMYSKNTNYKFKILYNIDSKTLNTKFYLQFKNINFNYDNMELEKVEYSDNKYYGKNKLDLLELSKEEIREIEKWCI